MLFEKAVINMIKEGHNGKDIILVLQRIMGSHIELKSGTWRLFLAKPLIYKMWRMINAAKWFQRKAFKQYVSLTPSNVIFS